jgi:perosamine synthetase
LAQLERLDEFVEKKRFIGEFYTKELRDIKSVQLPLQKTDYAQNIYWIFGIILKEEIDFDAAEMMKKLETHGVGSRPFFWPMHEQPVFRKMGLFANESHPVAERLARRGFYLPSGLALTTEQIEEVARAVRRILR